MLKLIFTISLTILLSNPLLSSAQETTDAAQKIYDQTQKSVYQILVINKATGKKSTIGSGFQFTQEGHIATNFHVVSLVIHKPKKYRVEYIRHDGVKGPLQIIGIDAIHDLAITKPTETYPEYLSLGQSILSKGERIYSMGNPHDLGMSIVEGIFNGLMEQSLYKKILFSGSLNPGMSGGPALNHNNEIVGVNVSTAGNDISFLIAVEYLDLLYKKLIAGEFQDKDSWHDIIEAQLLEHQNNYINDLLNGNWDTFLLGETTVPGEISNIIRCWGESKDKKKDKYTLDYTQCSSDDYIFLNSNFYTGHITYKYAWLTNRGFHPFRFYKKVEQHFSEIQQYSNAGKEDVTNFECTMKFVEINQNDYKASLCIRNYKKYSQLYDINFSLASIDKIDKSLMAEVIALGISQERSKEFLEKFMRSIQWIK